MKRLWIVLVLIILYSPISLAKDISLLWDETKIKEETLLQFAKKDINEIIETIRKDFGVTVIILNKKAKNDPINPDLKIINQVDPEIVKYYEKDSKNQTGIKCMETPLAEFLLPHFHAHDKNIIIERPLLDKPLILVTQSANRMSVIHELIHYLIYKESKEKTITLEGKLHAFRCAKQLQLIDAREKQQKFQEENVASPTSDEKERMKKATSYYDLLFDYYSLSVQYSLAVCGEEMDVHHLMYVSGDKLGFSQKEKILSHAQVGHNFNDLDDKLYPLVADPNLKLFKRDQKFYSQGLQDKFQKLENLKQEIRDKMITIWDWYYREKEKLFPKQKENSK